MAGSIIRYIPRVLYRDEQICDFLHGEKQGIFSRVILPGMELVYREVTKMLQALRTSLALDPLGKASALGNYNLQSPVINPHQSQCNQLLFELVYNVFLANVIRRFLSLEEDRK